MIFDCGGYFYQLQSRTFFKSFLANRGNLDIRLPRPDRRPGITRYPISMAAVLDSIIRNTEYMAKAHC
jgi:hypothetical protein